MGLGRSKTPHEPHDAAAPDVGDPRRFFDSLGVAGDEILEQPLTERPRAGADPPGLEAAQDNVRQDRACRDQIDSLRVDAAQGQPRLAVGAHEGALQLRERFGRDLEPVDLRARMDAQPVRGHRDQCQEGARRPDDPPDLPSRRLRQSRLELGP